MARLPEPGKDVGTWGIILNDFLNQSHNADGSIKDNAVTVDLSGKVDKVTGKSLISDTDITRLEGTSGANTGDQDLSGIDAQLADIARYKPGFDEYSFFVKPSDFTPTLPCNFYRDANGDIQHDMNFSVYLDGTDIYVKQTNGSDATGDGSSGNPYKTLSKAIDVANAGEDNVYIIRILDHITTYGFLAATRTITNKTISIIADNEYGEAIITSQYLALSWDADENVWKSTRGDVYRVIDYRLIDDNGLYVPLLLTASLADCKSTLNSWYTDLTYVWVNTFDGGSPTNSTIAALFSTLIFDINLAGTAKLYCENIQFVGGRASNNLRVYGDTTGVTVIGEIVMKNCKFSGGSQRVASPANAFNTNCVKTIYMFDCIAAYAELDGLNYHFTAVPVENRRDCFVMEYNCLSYNNGLHDSGFINNCTTCHEGVNILRVNSVGYNSKGPICADVNGCYTICVDCLAHDSVGDAERKTAYWFDNSSHPAGAIGKAILINCDSSGTDATVYSIATDADFDLRLYRFTGNNFGSTTIPKIIV